MNNQMILELVGYFASLLVLVSLLMTSVVKLRVINTVGSLIFAVYALFIRSYPTAVMNFCLVGINIFYLVRMARTERVFTLLPAAPEEAYVQYFLRHWQADIRRFFAARPADRADTAFLVCCEDAPAGILTGRVLEEGVLEVFLDYTTPQYRDCSVGRFLYQRLAELGFRKLLVEEATEVHGAYLRRMGFVQEGGRYVKILRPE